MSKFKCFNHKRKPTMYKCEECELLICPKCDPDHSHKNAIRMYKTLYGKAEVKPCNFCGERDENKIAIENLGISFENFGQDYSFCVNCLKNITAFDFVNRLAKQNGYKLPLIVNSFNLSNHILIRGTDKDGQK